MSTLSDNIDAAPAVDVPVAQVEQEEDLPVFAKSIRVQDQPPLPVITEVTPMVPVDDSVAPQFTTEYISPVEAVPGSGDIPGVQAEG